MKKIKRKNGRNSVENQRFPAVSIRYDSDWARTSDLYPVKVGDSNPISQRSVSGMLTKKDAYFGASISS